MRRHQRTNDQTDTLSNLALQLTPAAICKVVPARVQVARARLAFCSAAASLERGQRS
jgi:hypothetical protein